MKQQIDQKTTSSAFFKGKKVPSLSVFHDILSSAESIDDKIEWRQFNESDTIQTINLHYEWFPIKYGVYFFNRIIKKEVNCLIAEVKVTLNTQNFIHIVKKHRKKQHPLKINQKEKMNFYNLQSNIQKKENVQTRVIVGMVAFQFCDSRGYLETSWWKGWFKSDNNSCYILTLGVIEEFRKKGIAKLLIEELIRLCNNLEFIKFIFLHVIQYNSAAIRLYQKSGFHLLEDLTNFYNIQGQKFHGKALGIFLKDGKRGPSWKSWLSKLWN